MLGTTPQGANPRGKCGLGGAPVMDGYFENKKETSESMTNDGWFKTGDIGELDRNGQLRIIDRRKNLVKTQDGEYIALEKGMFLTPPLSRL